MKKNKHFFNVIRDSVFPILQYYLCVKFFAKSCTDAYLLKLGQKWVTFRTFYSFSVRLQIIGLKKVIAKCLVRQWTSSSWITSLLVRLLILYFLYCVPTNLEFQILCQNVILLLVFISNRKNSITWSSTALNLTEN